MTIYSIDKLMSETRHLAAQYHRLTGQALPVSNELARHDVINILKLTPANEPETGVDLIGNGDLEGKKIQVKSRVIFKNAKSRPKVGHFNFDGKWDFVILVLFNEDYFAEEMYLAARQALVQSNSPKEGKRAISIGKFKSLAKLIWSKAE